VQFARRYDVLGREIAAADARLEEARAREVAAAARVSEGEMALESARLAFTAAEAEATAIREQAHAKELEIGRHQQQVAFDRQQIEDLTRQGEGYAAEVIELEARREPAARAIETQKAAANVARETVADAARLVEQREAEYSQALAAVQKIEQEADQARMGVMAASTALSALQQARDHAVATRDRVAADRERLDQEARELEAEAAATGRGHDAAVQALAEARAALADTAHRRAAVEATLAGSRANRDRLVQALGARERELAAREARLHSLEELEVRRARFGDAARLLLAEAGEACRQRGAVADQLQVERSFERAVDALLGERLQYVLVDSAEDVTAALRLITERKAGRCGFIVLDAAGHAPAASADPVPVLPAGVRTLADVVRAIGPHASIIARLLRPALIVESFEEARALAATVPVPVATTSGDVFRGGWLVQSGSRQDAHGILETRAEVSSLRDDVEAAVAAVGAMTAELSELDQVIGAGQASLASLVAEQHGHEKAMVGFEAQTARAAEDQARLTRRLGVVATERARTEEELTRADARRDDAAATIVMRQGDHQTAEETLGRVLAGLQAARETAEAAMRVMSDSRTERATLVERVSGLDQEVARLEDAARDLQARIEGRQEEGRRLEERCGQLRESIAVTEQALDAAVQGLGDLTRAMQALDERVAGLRQELADGEQAIRGDRQALEAVRADVMQLEVARATATADLTHLAAACFEAVGASLEAVAETVSRLEAAGALVAPSRRATAEADAADGAEADEDDDEADAARSLTSPLAAEEGAPGQPTVAAAVETAPAGPVDPEPIMADLRRKIERLGPVNMMAIEQFDELESRHTFLSTQRQDLLDSIAQTGEAIKKIELTTRQRFADAFASINRHFEQTFTTLFGGGRAGLVLIDHENEPESGIDIIAQPPGKRLQNVQLLSGGEKALTAMALMFAVFKYRPSPFCLLDEIDAPLDDANIGRFVEMLQGMQTHTQFILITHNRKTMEIADRLYGVTMEEPGVSKLISIQLN
jgi:chromosome segregation protein